MFGVVVVSALVSMVVTRMTINHNCDEKRRFQRHWQNTYNGYPPSTSSFPNNNGYPYPPNTEVSSTPTQPNPQQQFPPVDRPNGLN